MPRGTKGKKSMAKPLKPSQQKLRKAQQAKSKELFAKMGKTKLFPTDLQPVAPTNQ